jgi:CxxC motif-containing protein (DUF1111 family)
MSIGGKVIETIDTGDKVWVNTNDKHSECAVYVERNAKSRSISEGDMLWWQAGCATGRHMAAKEMPYYPLSDH